MEVYAARQPIFNRNHSIYGYELLYRSSSNNYYDGIDDSDSTAILLINSLLVMNLKDLTDDSRGFINFSDILIKKEIPFLLPKENVVIEILERVDISPSLIDALKKLKSSGYILALDDFVFSESYIPLIELADIIKVEFPIISIADQRKLIEQYKGKVKFLAEKIETREEYDLAYKLGYDYFQGYFFSKPLIVKGEEIKAFDTSFASILVELDKIEPDYQAITEIVEKDVGLTYKLLKASNSVCQAGRFEISSPKQAIVRMGLIELKKWVYLMKFKSIQTASNKTLIELSLIRAKLMELLSLELNLDRQFEFYMAGIFSSIDVLLNKSMKDATNDLPFSLDVKNALLGEQNIVKEALDFIISHEKANWSNLSDSPSINLIPNITDKYILLYIQALKWVKTLDNFKSNNH